MVEEFSTAETKAPFNMAIDTLRRLGDLLREIKRIRYDLSIPQGIRQSMLIIMVKEFFVNAYPLLPEKVADNLKKSFEQIKPVALPVMTNSGGVTKKTSTIRYQYDEKIDVKIYDFLLSTQRELQREKYFMPPKGDLGTAVGRF